MCKFARKMADIAPLKDMIGVSKKTAWLMSLLLIIIPVKELNPGPEVQTHEQMRGMSDKALSV